MRFTNTFGIPEEESIMNVLSTVDRIVTVAKLKTALDRLGDRFLPVLNAEAGGVDCWRTDNYACNGCGTGWYWWYTYFAESHLCSLGWPSCQGCQWSLISYGCSTC
jgi:hypothetical protein